ncbi:MAG: hypothetical protein ACE5IQ_08430 [Candidatus Methylomirabilales bacterium]
MDALLSRQLVRRSAVLVLGSLLGLLPGQAQALSLTLSSSQIGEAIRYGERAQALPFALFAREWRAEGMQKPGQPLTGSAWLQSPFARVAHAGWAAAHRALSLTPRDLERQLMPVRDHLAFAVTLALPPEHPPAYRVSLHQAGEIFNPSHVETHQDPPDRGTAWVYIYCLFPAARVDLRGPVVLVVTDAHGDLLPFVFDLSRIR